MQKLNCAGNWKLDFDYDFGNNLKEESDKRKSYRKALLKSVAYVESTEDTIRQRVTLMCFSAGKNFIFVGLVN